MKAISLFSGIGGLDIAAEWQGIETVAFCEIEEFPSRILEKRWPGVRNLNDIRKFSNRILREMGGSPYEQFAVPADYRGTIDVVHGGFPCQDLSVAGRQEGLVGARSGLWFEMLRVVTELRPDWVVAENVRGSINLALDVVKAGLEEAGYEIEAVLVPASAFGAPHQRERVFFHSTSIPVADALNERLQGGEGAETFPEQGTSASESTSERSPSGGEFWATPSVKGNFNRRGISEKAGDGLATQVSGLWPTPRANKVLVNSEQARRRVEKTGYHGNLEEAVAMWPTPSACRRGAHTGEIAGEVAEDGKSRTSENGTKWGATLETAVGTGQLNPDWVECMMGFPIGWTDPDCAEPEPWPGWPALMGEKLWATPQTRDYRSPDNPEGVRATRKADQGWSQNLNDQCIVVSDQYPYEPPRTVTGCKNRAKRLKALGNAVVPQQAEWAFMAIRIMKEAL